MSHFFIHSLSYQLNHSSTISTDRIIRICFEFVSWIVRCGYTNCIVGMETFNDLLHRFFVFMERWMQDIRETRSCGKSIEKRVTVFSLNFAVRTTNLGPSFENQHDPDLFVDSSAKKRSQGILKDRYIVVDDHPLKNSFNLDSDIINAISVSLPLVIENTEDPLRSQG